MELTIRHSIVRFAPLVIILAACLLFSMNIQSLWNYTMDDSYIFYRYANNLYQGGQIAFNLNDVPPAEGLTSPLWMIILSVSYFIGVDIEVFSKVLGIVFSLCTALLLYLLVHTNVKRMLAIGDEYSRTLGALSVFVLLSDPYFSGNAISGMETALAGFMVLGFYKFAAVSNTKYLYLSPLIGLLVCLVRPEAVLFVILVYVIAYSDKRDLLYLKQSLLFIFLGIVYFFIRYHYYDTFLPLPFYIKQSFLSGLGYTLKFLLYWKIVILILMAGILFVNVKKYKTSLFLPILVVIGFVLYWLTPEHLMGFGYRYFQPIVGFMILSSVTIIAMILKNNEAFIQSRIHSKLIPLIIIFSLFSVSLIASETKTAYNMYNDYLSGMRILEGVGKAFSKLNNSSHRSIGMTDCGAVPYYSNWKVTDIGGLNHRTIALDYTPQTVREVLKSENPDIVILVSKNIDWFNPVFKHETAFESKHSAMGYRLMCSIDIYSNYKYFLYARDTDFGNEVIEVLEENKVRVYRHNLPSLKTMNQS